MTDRIVHSATKRAVTATAVTARSRLLVTAALAAALLLAACAPATKTPGAASDVRVEPTVTVSASASPESAATTAAQASPADGRIAIDPADARDLVRDELPGYEAGALHATPFALTRTYTPADRATHDRLTVTAWRYADPSAARRAMEGLSAEKGVTHRAPAEAAGLEGYTYVQAGERVLVLADAQTVLRLQAGPLRGDPEALTAQLVEVAEMLLD